MPKIIKTKIKSSKSKKKYSKSVAYLISAAKGLAASVVGFIIITLLLHRGNDFNTFYKLMVYLVIGSGGIIAGYSAHKMVKGRGFLDGIAAAIIYSLALILLLAIILKLNASSRALLVVPIGLLSGFVGGVIKA